jgi:hypothetical protein
MKLHFKRLLPVLIAVVLILVFAYLSPAWAVTWAEQPLLAWEQTALKFFDRDDYDKVINLAKGQDRDPNRNAVLLIYFSHAQKYYMDRNRASAIHYKQRYHSILNRLSGTNLAVLTRLVAMPQMSWNRKINKAFLNATFERAGRDEHLGAILFYLEGSDPDIAKGAIKGLHAILQHKRTIVMNGGTLGKTDRAWISDKRLLRLLIKMTGQAVSPITGFISKLPAIVRKKAMGGAPACLALIEDPALPMLRDAASYGNTNAAATIQLVQDAMGARLAKYPNSTWYSATGN